MSPTKPYTPFEPYKPYKPYKPSKPHKLDLETQKSPTSKGFRMLYRVFGLRDLQQSGDVAGGGDVNNLLGSFRKEGLGFKIGSLSGSFL